MIIIIHIHLEYANLWTISERKENESCTVTCHLANLSELRQLRTWKSRKFVITGKPARSIAIAVLFLFSRQKNAFFSPHGWHVAPINVKFGTGEWNAKFHIYWGRNVVILPPRLSKFRILAINLPLRGDSFTLFLRNSQLLYASIGSS